MYHKSRRDTDVPQSCPPASVGRILLLSDSHFAVRIAFASYLEPRGPGSGAASCSLPRPLCIEESGHPGDPND